MEHAPQRRAPDCNPFSGHGDMWRESMKTSNEDFYQAIDGPLTAEQAAQALALEQPGDTGGKPETGGEPTSTTSADDKKTDGPDTKPSSAQGADDPSKAGDAKPVVLAKDGVHTIPYEKLEEARRGEQHWKAQAEAAQQKLDELQVQAQARAQAGEAATATDQMAATAQAAIDAGANADIFGDFSEAALKAGIEKLVAQQVTARVNEEVGKALKPLQAQQKQDATAEHYDTIYKAHPNADSIAQSAEFKAWVDAQPSAVRNAYWQLFDGEKGGTATEIVEVFDAFTQATGGKSSSQPAAAATTAAAAKAATAAARSEPPASLSSIPGGRADGQSAGEAMADMGGQELYAALEGKSPDQIEAWLNRQI